MGKCRHWLRVGMVLLVLLPVLAGTGTAGEAIGKDKVWNIAHRGASGHAPESTLSAYQMARRMGADWVELDLHLTRDGQLVVIHDQTVDRTTNGKGPVRRYTLAQLKQLDAGSWFGKKHPRKWNPEFQGLRIPTLEEVLRLKRGKIRFSIEIKKGSAGPELEGKLIRMLEKHRLLPGKGETPQVMIISFDRASLNRVHQLMPRVPLIQLFHYREAGYLSPRTFRHIAAYADGIGYDHRRMSREDIRRAHRHGLVIHPYTVNHPQDMRRLIRWGVDGIVTNYPDRLNRVLNKDEG
ncbi:glycerophosphoryl diester phosphodiesterase [Kroppenstedtia guangzhouensis]|uniref:Glycerophosphoryl diester phosphodiesterase n=1 Tax=Kroppenstedtia guangzhouensis TaxID=1274356 RepID=A0ABQ1GYQ1_9BACL|nr:glycerophosphodiester phosphodiesterase [Kroppenstedtia guangzhouensis]GGA52057.1 glycerophosphoryl diester phosphodiesterase [Kroppenstedtia guangzhouensis]